MGGIKWEGNEITEIFEDSQAQSYGLQKGWIIHKVNGEKQPQDTKKNSFSNTENQICTTTYIYILHYTD